MRLEPSHQERLGEIQDLHAGANGNCPYQALQGGRILFRLHIFQDTVGKGYGIRTKERIPKVQEKYLRALVYFFCLWCRQAILSN